MASDKLKELLQQFKICLDEEEFYEFPSFSLPWYSDEAHTNVEVEIDVRGTGQSIQVYLSPDLCGIVPRTLVMACEMRDGDMKRMVVSRELKENMAPELEGELVEAYNAYLIAGPDEFLTVLRNLLAKAPGPLTRFTSTK